MDRFEDLYASTPPAPPPKPGSHEVSRLNTPSTIPSPRPVPPIPDQRQHSDLPEAAGLAAAQRAQIARPQTIPDPGDQWLPKFLEDKSCVRSPSPCPPRLMKFHLQPKVITRIT